MTLHLVRLAVDRHALDRYATDKRITDDDDGYALHRALRDRFSAAGPQPFRFFPEHHRGAHLLGYTPDAPAFADAAGLPIADPRLRDVFPSAPDVQPMPATWREGALYAFEVRVRPIVRYGKRIKAEREAAGAGKHRRAGEIDAFLAACEKAEAEHGPDARVDRTAVYLDWLAQRLAPAVALEELELRLQNLVHTERSRHGKRGMQRVAGPDVIAGGTLAVRDPAAFAHLLARGVGRHAAFGFGMLLLSPPGRRG